MIPVENNRDIIGLFIILNNVNEKYLRLRQVCFAHEQLASLIEGGADEGEGRRMGWG
jgi:hypothetical protein